MNKLKNIIEGWLNRFRPIPPVQKALFDDRFKICQTNECGMLKHGVCTACGCPIKAKTKSLDEECPENVWNPVLYEYNGIQFIEAMDLPAIVLNELTMWMILRGKQYIPRIEGCNALSWGNWQEFKEYLRREKI